jgi:hypothetical protein
MGFLIRLIVIALIIYIAYRLAKYMMDPKRKIESAVASGTFYFEDDRTDPRKNFHIAFKGVLFAGEKYMGTGEDAGTVESIFVWTEDSAKLDALGKEDFRFLEDEIRKNYPDAQINWKNPIEQVIMQEG